MESEPGKGTTFTIYLPRVDELPQPHADETIPETTRGSETVLLVEDDNVLRELIHEGLREAGYKVLVAANGVEALRTSEQNPAPIDVLITDVIMPQMNGPDLARALALRRPGMKVLFISGYTDDKFRCGQLADPDITLIQKPFQLIDLTQKLRQIIDRPDFMRSEERGRT